jgi:hypothetical protein
LAAIRGDPSAIESNYNSIGDSPEDLISTTILGFVYMKLAFAAAAMKRDDFSEFQSNKNAHSRQSQRISSSETQLNSD